jgi:hypothetical protein
MKIRTVISLFAALGFSNFLALAASEQAAVFRPGEIWPDMEGTHINAHGGGMLFYQGAYYWFGQHMIAGGAGNAAMVGVRCYSSQDLAHWKNEGVALAVTKDPQSDITRGCILERPKVIFNRKTGKFAMWFHLELKGAGYGTARCGVAVSESVAGPYRFIESFRLDANHWPENVIGDLKKPLTKEEAARVAKLHLTGGPVPDYPKDLLFRRDFATGQMARDMTLFVDDDAKAYLIAASEDNGVLHISQLTDDYLKTSGRYVRVLPGDFNEAPAMFKRNGKYYLFSSNCNGWSPTDARSAVADSVWGPYTKLGNPCRGPESEVTFRSQSTYILPLAGMPHAYIFMADRWKPDNAIDGRYVWLPVLFEGGQPVLRWFQEWKVSSWPKSLSNN